MLIHGVTRPITFTLDARWNGPTIDVVGIGADRARATTASPRRTP